jgi:hypothetical protein
MFFWYSGSALLLLLKHSSLIEPICLYDGRSSFVDSEDLSKSSTRTYISSDKWSSKVSAAKRLREELEYFISIC